MHISVTAIAADRAVTVLSVATTFTVMTVHHCYTNVNIAVTVL